jgi:predicted RNase H-like nuclease (RuvC/YqgF family)
MFWKPSEYFYTNEALREMRRGLDGFAVQFVDAYKPEFTVPDPAPMTVHERRRDLRARIRNVEDQLDACAQDLEELEAEHKALHVEREEQEKTLAALKAELGSLR